MDPVLPPVISEPNRARRAGIAASVAIHLAFVIVAVGYAGFLPFPSMTEQTIAVDVVTPQEVAKLTKPADPTPAPDEAAKPPAAAPPPPAPSPAAAAPPPPQPAQQAQSQTQQAAKPQLSAEQKPQPEPPKPEPSKPVQPIAEPAKPAMPAEPQTAIRAPEPDLSVKYPMNFSQFARAPSDFDARADSTAALDSAAIAAFRAQLKTCATLPADIKADDKIRIVIRAAFTPDGRLAGAPTLIEASASMKGPLLMQAAIAALQSCQPYAGLPAEKYPEWKLLDLSFTPTDFKKS